jgi:hypothetical protein
MADISGVTDFAHLAVAGDVDTGVGLFLHDVVHGAGDGGFELLGIHGLAAILREEEVHDILRTGKAADVSG